MRRYEPKHRNASTVACILKIEVWLNGNLEVLSLNQ